MAVLGGHRALHLGEVGGPVAEAQAEGQAEDDADPVADRVVAADSRSGPRLDEVAAVGVPKGVEQRWQATGQLHRDDRQRDHSDQHDEELHDLVVDCAGQTTEQDVREHEYRRQYDRDDLGDSQQRTQYDGQRVQVHAGDQHASDREGDGVDQVRLGVEPQSQVFRDAANLRAVVEGHHHDAEKDHGRDGADPEIVHDRAAVFGAAS